jgi:cyclopropane fatty-acyl-phospholipid synthase-like methyltransferase
MLAATRCRTRLVEDIVRYYEETWNDYRTIWSDRRSRALHFGYYDERASSHADALLNSNRVLADFAAVRSGDTVLDAGCGIGGSTLWLAAHRQARCIGVTPVAKQVRQASALAADRRLGHLVDFICSDYTSTPFKTGYFDVVWALESLCHATHKRRFYEEAARVLKPGGRLVVAEYIRSRRPADPDHEKLLRTWFDGWTMPDLDTREEHQEAAVGAGFCNVLVHDLTPMVRRSLLRLHRLASMATPIDRLLHRLRLRTTAQHRNVVASRVQYDALERGLWFYGVVSARRS